MNRSARRIASTLAALSLAIGGAGVATPAEAGPHTRTTPQTSADGRFLIVADPAAGALYVYPANGSELVGQLSGVSLSTHPGTTTLPDGRIAFVDDTAAKVRFLKISAAGQPRIVKSVDIPTTTTWQHAAWTAVDPTYRFMAISSSYEDATTQTVTVVDLRDYSTHQISVPLREVNGEFQEVQVYLAGEPEQLVVTVGNRFESYSLRSILRGAPARVTGTAPLRYLTHGPVVAPDGSTVYSTTEDGFDSARVRTQREWRATGANDRLGRTRAINYTADPTANAGLLQDYRPRLAYDSKTVFGAVSTTPAPNADPAAWATVQNYLHTVDLAQTRSSVHPLAPGIISRSAISSRLAVYSQIGGSGDRLLLLNAQARQGRFGKVLARIALPRLSHGPQAGTPTTGTETRTVAVTQRGDLAYVSAGGDGTVSVADTRTRKVVRTLKTPSSLTGGGYLLTYTPGAEQVDLIGR